MKTYSRTLIRTAVWLAVCGGWMTVAQAQQGIYTCVDSKGRKLTSDRPIAECTDREQKELTGTGTVKRVVKPVPTADELLKIEAQQKVEEEERARQAEQKRRDRAMLARYPNRAAHDKERAEALAQVDAVMGAANRRIVELASQRKRIDEELEFYKADPSKAPPALRRQIDENISAVDVQRRFIRGQDEEKKRVNLRFDEELARLVILWAQVLPPAAAVAAQKAASK